MNQRRRPLWKSPWLWIGLSGGVLVLAAGLFVLISLLPLVSYYKPGGYRDRIRNEPTLLFAEMAARKDSNVKVVSRDTERHTVTLRNQKTGERFVLGLTDEDKLRLRTEAGEVVLSVSKLQPNCALYLGSGAGPMPSWMPVLPDAKPLPLYIVDTGEFVFGGSLLIPSGPVEDVYAFYRVDLERKGFKLVPGDLISASSPGSASSLLVTPTEQGGRAGLLLNWTGAAGNP